MLLLVLLAVGDSLRSDLGRARGSGERKELPVAGVGRSGDREERQGRNWRWSSKNFGRVQESSAGDDEVSVEVPGAKQVLDEE